MNPEGTCSQPGPTPESGSRLQHLPQLTGHAAENMAVDQLLLLAREACPQPCFRHYRWARPAFTFGFAQNWGAELDELHAQGLELIRRETGGGLVDHRNDWTYTLILPGHKAGKAWCAIAVYAQIHRCLVEALRQQGVDAVLHERKPEPLGKGVFSSCFRRAEEYDVLIPGGAKIAGAAQRKSKPGVLFQGYIDRIPLAGLDWQRFEAAFVARLAVWLGLEAEVSNFPKWEAEALEALVTRFASAEWNHHRKRTACANTK